MVFYRFLPLKSHPKVRPLFENVKGYHLVTMWATRIAGEGLSKVWYNRDQPEELDHPAQHVSSFFGIFHNLNSWVEQDPRGSAGIGTQMHPHKEECGRSPIVNSSREWKGQCWGRRQGTNHIRGRDSTGNTESRKWPKLQLGKPKGMHLSLDTQ